MKNRSTKEKFEDCCRYEVVRLSLEWIGLVE